MQHLPLHILLPAVAARTVLVLLALVFGIRVFGKRNVGGLNMLDLVMVLLLGNAIQNAITSGSGHLGVGLVAAGALLAADHALGILFVREPWLEGRLFGDPAILVRDGQLDRRVLAREEIDEDEILAAAREQGLSDLSRVHLAVLEDDGTISVIPAEQG